MYKEILLDATCSQRAVSSLDPVFRGASGGLQGMSWGLEGVRHLSLLLRITVGETCERR